MTKIQIERTAESNPEGNTIVKKIVETQSKESDWVSYEDLKKGYVFVDGLFQGHYVPRDELSPVELGDLSRFSHAYSVRRSVEVNGQDGAVVRRIDAYSTLKAIAKKVREPHAEYEDKKYVHSFFEREVPLEALEGTIGMHEVSELNF